MQNKRIKLNTEVDDGGERVCLKACTSHQCAVYVGLSHESFDVFGFNTSPVEDPHFIRCFLVVEARQKLPDERVRFLCLGVGGCSTGADRPNRLVGDNDVVELLPGDPGQTA